MRKGFTLVELLVVIGIIAILMALTAMGSMWAVNAARRTAIGIDVATIHEAVEKYKSTTGDYPPNFRDAQTVLRHIRRCYPKTAPAVVNVMFDLSTTPPTIRPAMQLDESESLVFWLTKTRNDPLYPFDLTPIGYTGGMNSALQSYIELDERRLFDGPDADPWKSLRAKYSKDSFIIYIDSRAYPYFGAVTAAGAYVNPAAMAEGDTANSTRPYLNSALASPDFVNKTTFQILCAGQDGIFGPEPSAAELTAYPGKSFPAGQNYTSDDRDNLTNFSEGRTLEDHIP